MGVASIRPELIQVTPVDLAPCSGTQLPLPLLCSRLHPVSASCGHALLEAFQLTCLSSVPSTTVSILFKANQTTSLLHLGSLKRAVFLMDKVHLAQL